MDDRLSGRWGDGTVELDLLLRARSPGGGFSGACSGRPMQGCAPASAGASAAFAGAVQSDGQPAAMAGVLFLDAPGGLPVLRLMHSRAGHEPQMLTLRPLAGPEALPAVPGLALPRGGRTLDLQRLRLVNHDPRSPLRLLDLLVDADGRCVGTLASPAEQRGAVQGFAGPQGLALTAAAPDGGSLCLVGWVDRDAGTAGLVVCQARALAYEQRQAAVSWRMEAFRITPG
ncbi:hypothetical protein SNE35_12295 [Paucibacter sp. R3-3]|uniref:Uncharacterized protein n=1 Tax=Roseateles agri TaxID=3098619 RepID=A0ABU5DHS1_9BURK|nr:hypothetical protein [Paucibacter sp. R3-3]MDY0745293.1 hypothetical protein [Paucibacter sp. R3-3]